MNMNSYLLSGFVCEFGFGKFLCRLFHIKLLLIVAGRLVVYWCHDPGFSLLNARLFK